MNKKRKTVFLVDDSVTYLTLGNNALSEAYTIHTVNSGARMFKLLEKVRPDLIILDIEMPEMDGYEAMERLKKNPSTADIPVIFLTSHDDEEKELQGFSMGAVDYITKPFSAPLLLKRIEVHLLIESQRRSLVDYSKNLKQMAEERAKEVVKAHEMAQTLLEASPLLIETWDENMNIVDCNRQALDTFGVNNKNEYFSRYNEFTPEFQPSGARSQKEFALNTDRIMQKGEHLRYQWTRQFANGEPLPTEITGVRVNRGGKALMICYIHDLRPIKSAMEESNRAKSKFFARMSHELRTPISSVLGISELQLRNPDLPTDVEKSFAMINASASTLLAIINDILDLSKIESEKMTILSEEYSTANMIGTIANIHFSFMAEGNIKLNLSIDENLPTTLVGDSLRIVQITNNLLSNAFKYTTEGSVALTIKNEPCPQEDFVTLAITIQDTGVGMSSEQVEKLRRPNDYTRFHEAEMGFVSGTGLGMPIVYSLVKLMGAKFDIQSQVGKGTVVKVSIPQKISGNEILGKQVVAKLNSLEIDSSINAKGGKFSPEPMPYGKVLIVDDVDANLFVAKGLMRPYGLTIETALTGSGAVQKVRDGNVYDIVFMDHMMPIMDGMEATKLIREGGYTGTIIALTANAVVGQREIFLANGFDGFISKPIDTRHLDDILNKHIRDKYPPEVRRAHDQHREHAPERAHSLEAGDNSPHSHAVRRAHCQHCEHAPEPGHSLEVGDGVQGSAPLFDAGNYIGALKEIPALEVDAALDAMNGMTDVYEDTAKLTLRLLPDRIKEMDSLLENDTATFITEVHGIKSVLRSIGAFDLGEMAAKIEAAGLKSDIAYCEEHYPAFRSALEELETALAAVFPPETSDGTKKGELLREAIFALEVFDRNTALEKIKELEEIL